MSGKLKQVFYRAGGMLYEAFEDEKEAPEYRETLFNAAVESKLDRLLDAMQEPGKRLAVLRRSLEAGGTGTDAYRLAVDCQSLLNLPAPRARLIHAPSTYESLLGAVQQLGEAAKSVQFDLLRSIKLELEGHLRDAKIVVHTVWLIASFQFVLAQTSVEALHRMELVGVHEYNLSSFNTAQQIGAEASSADDLAATAAAAAANGYEPRSPSTLAMYHLSRVTTTLEHAMEYDRCPLAEGILADLQRCCPNEPAPLRLWRVLCDQAHVAEVAPKILPALGLRELKARNDEGGFLSLSSLADPPKGRVASPTHLAFLEAVAASATAADSLASRVVYHTDATTAGSYSNELFNKFVQPAVTEARLRLYLILEGLELLGLGDMARATKHRIEAAVRTHITTNKLSLEMRRLAELQLRNQGETVEQIASKLAALLVNAGVAPPPAAPGQPAAAADPAQQAQQASSEAAATTAAAAEAEQAAEVAPEAAAPRAALQQAAHNSEPAEAAAGAAAATEPNAAAADGTAPPVQAEQRPSATKGWVKFGEEEQLEAAAEDSAAGPDEPAAMAVAVAQDGATGPGEPAAVPAAAATPAGFKSWGANPLYCSGGGANSAPAAPFGVKSLDVAAADKEQRAAN